MAGLKNIAAAGKAVRMTLVEEHPEIAKDGRSSRANCRFEEVQCRERRRIADAHMALVERAIFVGLVRGDRNHDAMFTGDEVAAAAKAALEAYTKLRELCRLPGKPADEGAFNRCLQRSSEEQVR